MNRIYIGFDRREAAAYKVAKRSMKRRSSVPLDIVPLKLNRVQGILNRPVEIKDGKMWCPISQAPMATEFAISRFAVPFLAKTGWALFVDCDVVCLSDIAELFAIADDKFAVMCVKHDSRPMIRAWKYFVSPRNPIPRQLWVSDGRNMFHKDAHDGVAWKIGEGPGVACVEVFGDEALAVWENLKAEVKEGMQLGEDLQHLRDHYSKMDGQLQTDYPRKNWSSVVLWNCDHPANKELTIEVLNTWPGRDLHAFKWLKDEEIGNLPVEWNYLVGVTTEPVKPKLAHFTLGGPWFKDWKGGPMDDLWLEESKGK